MRQFFLLVVSLICSGPLSAESWPDALAAMPLRGNATHLNRTNCVELLLGAFQSNATVKALIFMPGATDELFFFRRAQATLTNLNPSLLDAVVALTNQTQIRATFRAPFFLLHSAEDVLDLQITVSHAPSVEKLQKNGPMPHWVFNDRDWDALRKTIKGPIKAILWPGADSKDSRHFYRHTFTAWNLTGWETLQSAAYSGKTRLTVRRYSVVFEPDERVGVLPKLDHFP